MSRQARTATRRPPHGSGRGYAHGPDHTTNAEHHIVIRRRARLDAQFLSKLGSLQATLAKLSPDTTIVSRHRPEQTVSGRAPGTPMCATLLAQSQVSYLDRKYPNFRRKPHVDVLAQLVSAIADTAGLDITTELDLAEPLIFADPDRDYYTIAARIKDPRPQVELNALCHTAAEMACSVDPPPLNSTAEGKPIVAHVSLFECSGARLPQSALDALRSAQLGSLMLQKIKFPEA